MDNLRSILVILDKPKHKQVALQRAKTIQKATGAHLTLASFAWLPMAEERSVFDAHQRRALKNSCMNERREWLRGVVLDNKLAAADVSTEVIWTDDIAGWVSHKTSCDLVVKTVHHSKTMLHTPLDWQLLSSCPAPLLLASSKLKEAAGNVLATVDLRNTDRKHTRLNKRVLAAAQLFAGIKGSDLHAVNTMEFAVPLRDIDLPDLRKPQSQGRGEAKLKLQEMLKPYSIALRKQHMPIGKVGQTVAETAEKANADLVVVGTSAHRALGNLLLGGSAEKIISRSNCDVLAVHPS